MNISISNIINGRVPVSIGPSVIQDNLNIQWDIQDLASYSGSGTALVDLKGNNDGTLQLAPLYTTHLGAKSLRFDGTAWISFANNIVATDWTISFWASYYASNPYYNRFWASDGYEMELAFTNNSLHIYDGSWVNTGVTLNPTTEWHNLVVTYSNSPRALTVFKDGVQVYTGLRGRIMNNAVRLFIDRNGFDEANAYFGELLFYNNDLTPTEVLYNYNGQKLQYGR
jgi:hypothetical protein